MNFRKTLRRCSIESKPASNWSFRAMEDPSLKFARLLSFNQECDPLDFAPENSSFLTISTTRCRKRCFEDLRVGENPARHTCFSLVPRRRLQIAAGVPV